MARRTAPVPTPVEPPRAYSYIRFSTPEQAAGDSLRRQTERAAQWCERNGITLDTSTYRDLGVSAFTGKHRTPTAALGQFVEAVKAGRVPRGSYLIIESLDRLTRQDERTALRLWLDILDSGITIVTLSPETVFRAERSDMTDIIRAIIELSRAHSESAVKADRVGRAWADKKARARTAGHILTDRLPAWIRRVDARPSDRPGRGAGRVGGRLELDPDRAAVVRKIFALSAAGYGHAAVVKKLTADHVPPMGPAGAWDRSFVANVLRDRRAVGELQPRRRDGSADGPPIPNYYPPAVTEHEYHAARAAAGKRRNKPGSLDRVGPCPNVFAGLVTDMHDGDAYYLATRTDGGKHTRVLINRLSAEGRAACKSFPYSTFERGVLAQLAELDVRDVVGDEPADDALAVARNELAHVTQRITELTEEIRRGGPVAALAGLVREHEERAAVLRERVDAAETAAAVPVADAWAAARAILTATPDAGTGDGRDALRAVLGALDGPDPTDVRVRLRAAVRRVVAGIDVWFGATGRDRVAVVNVRFVAGGRRAYVLVHRPAKANASGRTPGRWWSKTLDQTGIAVGGYPGGKRPEPRAVPIVDLFGEPGTMLLDAETRRDIPPPAEYAATVRDVVLKMAADPKTRGMVTDVID